MLFTSIRQFWLFLLVSAVFAGCSKADLNSIEGTWQTENNIIRIEGDRGYYMEFQSAEWYHASQTNNIDVGDLSNKNIEHQSGRKFESDARWVSWEPTNSGQVAYVNGVFWSENQELVLSRDCNEIRSTYSGTYDGVEHFFESTWTRIE